jgi:hypothetical protein
MFDFGFVKLFSDASNAAVLGLKLTILSFRRARAYWLQPQRVRTDNPNYLTAGNQFSAAEN